MQEIALVYAIGVAWLGCWWVDLLVTVARTPPQIDPIIKLVIVTICWAIVLFQLWKHHWLFG